MTLRGSLRFARYTLDLWRRTWWGMVFSVFVSPILYLASIGLGLGSMINGGGESAALGGVTYAAFAGTGLMVANAFQFGVGAMAWPVRASVKYTKTWIAAVSTPLSPGDLFGGMLLSSVVRLVLAAISFVIALAAFGVVPLVDAAAAIPAAVLTGVAVSPAVFAFSVTVESDESMAGLFRFVVMPIFIVSGTFFPVSELPTFLQPAAVISPVWHGAELVRSSALNAAPVWPAWVHVSVLAVMFAATVPVAINALTKRLNP